MILKAAGAIFFYHVLHVIVQFFFKSNLKLCTAQGIGQKVWEIGCVCE